MLSKRELIEWALTMFILLLLALVAPSPTHESVNGKDVATLIINGWRMPDWMLWGIILVLLGLVYGTIWFISRRFWPEPEARSLDFEEFYMGEGGTVGWIPDVPGTPSPMAYKPFRGTSNLTAEDFIQSRGPNSMRLLAIGEDGLKAEELEFERAKDLWLTVSSESVLRSLLPLCEQIMKDADLGTGFDLLDKLVRAHELRGIPTAEDIAAFESAHDLED